MTTKNISSHVKAKLLYKKLQEMSDKGTLAMCRNRKEVGNMLGYTEERQSAGYIWVSKMIREGYLNESIYGENIYGKIEYQYHLSKKKPSYMFKPTGRGPNKKKIVVDSVQEKEQEVPSVQKKTGDITISYKDLKITLSETSFDMLKWVIDELIDKVKE